MLTAEFLARVRHQARLPSRDDTVRAGRATLETLEHSPERVVPMFTLACQR